MKKIYVFLAMSIVMSIILVGCSTEPVVITLAADMVGFARDAGIEDSADTEITNEDGSVTYTITKAKHSELLDKVSGSIEMMVAEVLTLEETSELFKEIAFSDDYTALTLKMDNAADNQFSLIVLYPVMFTCLTYQQFNGIESPSIAVTAIDAVTGEVLETTIP